jgi:hypothetical protein
MIDPTPWAHRPHPGPRATPLELSAEQRMDFEAAMRPEKAQRRIVNRAQAILLLADGVPTIDVSMLVGVHPRTVEKWRLRFTCDDPVKKLADAPRSGRPPSLSRRPTQQGS